MVAGEDLADLLPQRVGPFVLRLGSLLLAGEQVRQAVGPPQAVALAADAGAEAEALGVGELGDGVGAVLPAAVARPLLRAQLASVVTKFRVRTCRKINTKSLKLGNLRRKTRNGRISGSRRKRKARF